MMRTWAVEYTDLSVGRGDPTRRLAVGYEDSVACQRHVQWPCPTDDFFIQL